MANLQGANLQGAHLKWTDLEKVNLQRANLKGTHYLLIDQLSKVKTLYDTKLDEEFLIPLKKKYLALFDVPELPNLKDKK